MTKQRVKAPGPLVFLYFIFCLFSSLFLFSLFSCRYLQTYIFYIAADCRDLVGIGPGEEIAFTRLYYWMESGVVLQDTVANDDKVYYALYTSCFRWWSQDTLMDGHSDHTECFVLRHFQSYQDLEANNGKQHETNQTYMNVRCYIPTVRIMNGVLYCRKYNKYNSKNYNYLVKANIHTGAVIYEKELNYYNYRIPLSSDTRPDCCDYNLKLLIDETGMWLLYNSDKYASTLGLIGVLQLLDPHDFSVIYEKRLPEPLSNNQFAMVCGKLYELSDRSIKAYDLANSDNTCDFPADIDSVIVSPQTWMHYNPRLKQFFVGNDAIKDHRFNISTCSGKFPQAVDLSLINSTFLWALVPNSLTNNTQYIKMLAQLNRYLNDLDTGAQVDALNQVTTCSAGSHCVHPENRKSLYCRLKACADSLKVLTDYRHRRNVRKKILQTEFHMRTILEQRTLRSLSMQIKDLKHFGKMEFTNLKSVINGFKNELGTYFRELAKYDQDKAQADVDFIYGRLGSYNRTLQETAAKLEPKLTAMFCGAIGTVTTTMIDLSARLAFTIRQAVVPVPPDAGPLDVMEALDALAIAAVGAVHLDFLKREVFPSIREICAEMSAAVHANGVFHESVLNMIYAAERQDLNNTNLKQYYTDFLKQYNAYNPGITVAMIARFGTVMDETIDKLCELIFSGETVLSAPGQYVFAYRGDCFHTKVDVATIMAIYEEYYDFQYELLEAMASYVRANIAMVTSQAMVDVKTEIEIAQAERDTLKLKVISMEMFIISEVQLLMVIHDACSLIEYIKGGIMPPYCNELFLDPYSHNYDNLAAFNYDTDMCLRDEVKKFVRIPAAYPTESTPLPKGTIDLASLYSGNITSFQVPNQQWLIDNGWIGAHEHGNAWFIKRFELFYPYGGSSRLKIHVRKEMMGDNVITLGGTLYDFATPVTFNLRYTENFQNCYDTEKSPPYKQSPDCTTRSSICMESEGWNKPAAVHASVYSRWGITMRVTEGMLNPVKPVGDFYLQAGVFLCRVRTSSTRVYVAPVQTDRAAACCYSANQYYDQKQGSCDSCPTGGCVKLDGYFCGNCTLAWP